MTQPQTPAAPNHSVRMRQLAETRQQILALPAEQAMAAILKHPQPAALVHSFSEEDLHFLIHDIGLVDALPLIALASNRQWEYLLDMETWHKDRLNYPQTTQWLLLLLQADPKRLIKWCFDDKLEFLEFFLFRNIEVRVRESDQSPSDFGDGFFTDDDTFYVRLVDYPVATIAEKDVKSQRDALLKQLLRRLSAVDHPRYQGLLLEVAGIIPGEIEEELFRLRNVRLGEKGFLPFHEAVGVYQPLRPGDLAARGKKLIPSPSSEDFRFPVPQFTAAFLEGDNRFVRGVKGIREPHVIQRLQMELAGLCNQVIAADQEIIRGREQLKTVVSKVSGYLGIGLELMTANTIGDRDIQASALLQRHLLTDIFRTGFASALALKWKAARWYKASWSRQVNLTFWDEAWLGVLGGLLTDRPKFYDPSNAAGSYRDFQTREEIDASTRGLLQVAALDQLFKQMAIPLEPLRGIRLLTYKNLLLTLWARAVLKMPPLTRKTPSIAIPMAEFKQFYATLWTDRDGGRIIDDDKKADFLQWAAKAADRSPGTLSARLGMVFEALFDEIERELSLVTAANLDPRYINLFLLNT